MRREPHVGSRYPRYKPSPHYLPIRELVKRGISEQPKDRDAPVQDDVVEVRGRVTNKTMLSDKLYFFDLEENHHRIQIMYDHRKIPWGPQKRDFDAHLSEVKTGDYISARGIPGTSEKKRTLLVIADQLPVRYSQSLVPLPKGFLDEGTRAKKRHLELMVNKRATDTLRLRARILSSIRHFLDGLDFTEVQTPLLAADAGGAVARPFVTESTELRKRQLALRVAPELWLKRLVIGSMERVYELGPAFRNEGVDATHNPEFTTCEFYAAFWTLDDLMRQTESLVHRLALSTDEFVRSRPATSKNEQSNEITPPETSLYRGAYPRIEFIPALQKAMGFSLPPLSAPTARDDLAKLLGEKSISLGDEPMASLSLPKILDRLAAKYLEPFFKQSLKPVFLFHHPECMAPLAKSFVCPATKQVVSARAELYLAGTEVANMYEEENDPVEQRAKLERQAALHANPDGPSVIDEGYLNALEAGLPPTGGWGCGVDRLVMHFALAEKISEVLAFGNLRQVVALHRDSPSPTRRGDETTSPADGKKDTTKDRKPSPVTIHYVLSGYQQGGPEAAAHGVAVGVDAEKSAENSAQGGQGKEVGVTNIQGKKW